MMKRKGRGGRKVLRQSWVLRGCEGRSVRVVLNRDPFDYSTIW